MLNYTFLTGATAALCLSMLGSAYILGRGLGEAARELVRARPAASDSDAQPTGQISHASLPAAVANTPPDLLERDRQARMEEGVRQAAQPQFDQLRDTCAPDLRKLAHPGFFKLTLSFDAAGNESKRTYTPLMQRDEALQSCLERTQLQPLKMVPAPGAPRELELSFAVAH